MAKADQISIYRLDPERLAGTTGQAAFDLVIAAYDEKEAIKAQKTSGYQAKAFTAMEDSTYRDVVGEQDVSVGVYYSKKNNPHKLASFLRNVAPGNQLDQLRVQSYDMLVMIPVGTEIYAFTSGSAHHAIAGFIDDSFPIEIAKRLLDPEKIKQTKERLLIGSLYARDRYFRRSHRIAASESFGRVWKMVLGTIKREAVTQYGLDELFDGDDDLTCEVRSAFKVNKRITFTELYELIKKLDALRNTALTDEQKQAFGFLNSVKQVPSKDYALILKLNDQLLKDAYGAFRDPAAVFDMDFCNTEYDRYLSSDEILVHTQRSGGFVSVKPFDDGKKIMRALAGTFGWATFDEFKEDAYRALWVSSMNEENPSSGTTDRFIEHFHGEVRLNDQSYFLIDGNWYLVADDFFDRLNLDFKDVVKRDANMIPRAESPLIVWNSSQATEYTEGDFNEEHAGRTDCVVCDRITPYGIELCDILVIGEKNLYLFHNKVGFGASVRDVCSQIFNAARSIQDSIKSDRGILKKYYQLITGYSGSDPYRVTAKTKVLALGEDAFVRLFTEKTLIYVLGFVDDAQTERVLGEATADDFTSSIARFELVTLFENMRSLGSEIKICQIYRA